jgi:hypothetical protein
MEIEITEADDSEFDRTSTSLIKALVLAYGADLPERFERIREQHDHYDLYVNKSEQSGDSCGIGNAFGKVLATHGWVIIGISSHYEDDDHMDLVSVARIHDCDKKSTIFHNEGDEDKIDFSEV